MNIPVKKIEDFQIFIFSWWGKNRRDLPWRNTSNPYHILVSELMLQQTQAERVVPLYKKFLKKFPTIYALSASSLSNVIKQWKGLGYNRRAVYLHKIAGIVVDSYRGKIPDDFNTLLTLPGIGAYTAKAIQIFAFRKETAAVDTNIRQIYTLFFRNGKKSTEKIIEEIASKVLPKGKAWEWHQALMDYGSSSLKKKKRPIRKKNTIPFIQSNRYFRGRIVDMLREKKISDIYFLKELVKRFEKSDDFFIGILSSLVKDGLIEKKGKLYRLPE